MRPVIDFDPKSPFAFFYTLGVMCGWTPDRHRRARANLAPSVIHTTFGKIIPLIGRLREIAKRDIPPNGTLQGVVDEYLQSESLAYHFMAHVTGIVAYVRETVQGIPADMDDEEVYWRSLRIPGKAPYEAMINAVPLSELLPADEGIAAMGASPGIDVIDAEIMAVLKSDAYLAGLLLVLVATLHKHHSNLSASVNRACYILASEKLRGERARTMTHVVKTWKKWRAVAPLWAGAIVVAGHWDADALWEAISDTEPEALSRVFSLAKWFANFATKHKADRADKPLISAAEIVEMPDSVVPEEPNLSPLDGIWLEEANAYKAPNRYNFER